MSRTVEGGGSGARGDGEPGDLRRLATWFREHVAPAIEVAIEKVGQALAEAGGDGVGAGWEDKAGWEAKERLGEFVELRELRSQALATAEKLDEYAEKLEAGQAKIDAAREYTWFGDGRVLKYVDGVVKMPDEVPPPQLATGWSYRQLTEEEAAKQQNQIDRYSENLELLQKYGHVEGLVREARDNLKPVKESLTDLARENAKKVNSFLIDVQTGALAERYEAYRHLFEQSAADLSAERVEWAAQGALARQRGHLRSAKFLEEIEEETRAAHLREHIQARTTGMWAKALKAAPYAMTIVSIGADLADGESAEKAVSTNVVGLGFGLAGGAVFGVVGGALVGVAMTEVSKRVYDRMFPGEITVVLDDDWYVKDEDG